MSPCHSATVIYRTMHSRIGNELKRPGLLRGAGWAHPNARWSRAANYLAEGVA
jgi:hypothetical protein